MKINVLLNPYLLCLWLGCLATIGCGGTPADEAIEKPQVETPAGEPTSEPTPDPAPTPTAYDAVVNVAGGADYTTIQAAITAAPSGRTTPYRIFVANGTYEECIRVPSGKTFIHLIGESREGVKLQYALNRVGNNDGTQGTAKDDAWAYSCNNADSPSRRAGYPADQRCVALIEGANFYVENLSIINLYGALPTRYVGGLGMDGQAEALVTRADRFAMHNCTLVSFQDTWWYWHSNKEYIAYVSQSLIEGRTDYVWGSGNILVENSTFYNTKKDGYITASGDNMKWGFVMCNCVIDGENGVTGCALGRPYKPGTRTVWINTQVKVGLYPTHWRAWNSVPVLYAEYNTVDKEGILLSTEGRNVGSGEYAFTSTVLTKAEADEYTYEKLILATGWNPKEYMR